MWYAPIRVGCLQIQEAGIVILRVLLWNCWESIQKRRPKPICLTNNCLLSQSGCSSNLSIAPHCTSILNYILTSSWNASRKQRFWYYISIHIQWNQSRRFPKNSIKNIKVFINNYFIVTCWYWSNENLSACYIRQRCEVFPYYQPFKIKAFFDFILCSWILVCPNSITEAFFHIPNQGFVGFRRK